MGGLLTELGKKLAERWLTLLVVPGALYLAAAITAVTLGHAHPFAVSQLTNRLDQWTTGANSALLVILLIVSFLAAGTCGLAAQAVGALVERCWMATTWTTWPPPLRQAAAALTRRRQQRWDNATADYQQARDKAAAALAHARLTGKSPTPSTYLETAHRKVSRICAERPERPGWMGDRLNAVARRLDRDLDLDLAAIWPYLWLTAPDTTRTEITAAREALGRATTLAGWGLLYLVVGALWWPCLPLGLVVIITARQRARAATDTYAVLMEATVRLRTPALAQDLGLAPTGPLTRETGRALTCLLTQTLQRQP
jgi:hypothetical protein